MNAARKPASAGLPVSDEELRLEGIRAVLHRYGPAAAARQAMLTYEGQTDHTALIRRLRDTDPTSLDDLAAEMQGVAPTARSE